MPITEYQFHLNEQNLEIFPQNFYNDPYIIYHGTSTLFSEDIENNGFSCGVTPFDMNSAQELLEYLKTPKISVYDIPRGPLNSTTASGLQHYIDHIQSGHSRVSFSSLSSVGILFASGRLKGGQSLRYIGEAKEIIYTAVFNNTSIRNSVPEVIVNLFNFYDQIQQSPGVIYAVRIPANFEGIALESNVIHRNIATPLEDIVGKIIIPHPFELANLLINKKLTAKLLNPVPPLGLEIIIGRQESKYDIEIINPE